MNEVLISILRPLKADTAFDQNSTVKDLCLQLGGIDIETIEQYVKRFSLRDYSCMVLCGLYNTLFTVATYLNDPTTHQLFAKACLFMRQTAPDFPMAGFILQAVRAFAWATKMPIPTIAEPSFEGLGITKEELLDVPLAFTLPKTDAVRKLLCNGGDESRKMGVEMGRLLSKWGALSIE